ncbi:serine/threonine-protein kinase [Streptomyces sp. PT12]|uniref:serine/threonine-protein kinase n=1 Tax=Streptomyces sp. PT12 TaxID=1510197 RepID=UPI0015EEFD34|nr:serine/threonine-protein kinase [Streptomyces sp. PT12]
MEALSPGDPATIGPYVLLRRLGAGGMGQVFLGRSPHGRMVAVKVVHGALAREPEFRRRFRAEAEAARRVSGAWTAPVLDSDTESHVPWIATGYVVGPPLRHVIESLHGPLDEHSVWALGLGLARALTEIHGSGLIHRDLKPSNVMVTLEGPKVIDFGIARAVDASLATRTGAMIGTPGYMPPEQIRGEALTGAADVFALGAVLAYAATGSAPFAADGAEPHTVLYRVMYEQPELGPPNGRLTGELRDLVARCLAKNAPERPVLAEIAPLAEARAGTEFWLPQGLTARLGRDAADLLALDGPGASSPPAPPAPGAPTVPPTYPPYAAQPGPRLDAPAATPSPPPRPRRRVALLTAAVAGAAALAVVIALTAFNGDDGDGSSEAGATEGSGGSITGFEGEGEGEGAVGGNGGADPEAPLADLIPRDLRDAGILTVHAAAQDDPVLFHEENGSDLVGFEVDLMREIGERLGVEVTFWPSAEPEEAAAAAVEAGEESASHIAVAGFEDSTNERHELGVDFVNHFWDGWGVVSVGGENEGVLAELCDLTVATYDADFPRERLRANTENCPEPVENVTFGGRDDMAELLTSGEADAAMLLYSQGAYYVGENPQHGLGARVDGVELGPRGIAVPVGQDELREAVRTGLGALLEDGTYQELLERWHFPEAGVDEAQVNVGG